MSHLLVGWLADFGHGNGVANEHSDVGASGDDVGDERQADAKDALRVSHGTTRDTTVMDSRKVGLQNTIEDIHVKKH